MQMLEIQKEEVSRSQLIGLMLLAYLFSVVVRLIWVYQFQDMESFYWNGQLMINTNDGYFFASGAQKALGLISEHVQRLPDAAAYGITFLTALLAKFTPLSIETIILYLPAFISSLVVIPIILICHLYRHALLGFFAALIGSIAWSYYNRTMVGYYDTDMFSAMAPMFVLYFFMASVKNFTLKSALYAAIMIVIYPFLYDQGRAVVFAMSLIYFIYLYLFHRGEELAYKSIIIVSASTLPFYLYLSSPYNYLFHILVVVALYFFLMRTKFSQRSLFYASVLSIIIFLYFGNVFGLIMTKLHFYLSRSVDEHGLHFFQVTQTIREAGTIPFSTMANRISGSTLGVIVSLIGYVLLVIRYRPFILALPLIGIGVFSLWGGLRFTIYAVPIAAISAVFLFYVIANMSDKKTFRYVLIMILTALMLYPNIQHIIAYKVPTVFTKEEVKVLDSLKQKADPKDYVLAWWDYGYPIEYYAGLSTLIDGAKHNHDNFIISKILNSTSPMQAANLSREAVETYVKNGGIVADRLFKERDANELLDELSSPAFKLPQKTREIYLYLPQRMLSIFPTVGMFSNLDLVTGEQKAQPFFYLSGRFADSPDMLNLGNGIVLDKTRNILRMGNREIPLRRFVVAGYDQHGHLVKEVQKINEGAPLSLIYMRSYNLFLVLDEQMYNSLYIQMFVLGNYDKDLFDLVVDSPYAKVYRLKK